MVLSGGISGLVSVISYFILVFASLPASVAFMFAMLFSLSGIGLVFSIRELVRLYHNSYWNRLSSLIGTISFVMVALMLSVQLAVTAGMDKAWTRAQAVHQKLILESLRLVDMGMDVAWDLFIGTYMLLPFLAFRKIFFLKWWGLGFALLGCLLILVNLITFPFPPAEAGWFDPGPLTGLIILSFSAWLLVLGVRLNDHAYRQRLICI